MTADPTATAVEALSEIIFSKLKWFDALGQQCIDGDSIKDAARAALDYQALQPLLVAQGTIERLSAVALSMDRLGETQRASDIRTALQALQLHGGGESRSSLPPVALLEASWFRKRPVEVEARPLPALFDIDGRMALELWLGAAKARWSGDALLISTLEGEMRANAGDWIIKGVQGEFYPCKPDIFVATYEAVQ